MHTSTIAVITLITSVVIYFVFLLIGLGGISRNREAQGYDQKIKE